VASYGLGMFEYKINGKRIGDHVLGPGWSGRNDQIQYMIFDIADLREIRENRIG